MGKTITVMPNQSTMDVVVQGTGSLEAAMQFCRDNGISISDIPVTGTVWNLSAQAGNKGDAGNLKYFVQNEIVIGTLGNEGPPIPPPGPPLTMQIVLKPVMNAGIINPAIAPSVSGYYDFRLTEAIPEFIKVYGLDAVYLSSNNVHFIEETQWLLGHPFNMTMEISHNPATTLYLFGSYKR
jgi:hypothetical protein